MKMTFRKCLIVLVVLAGAVGTPVAYVTAYRDSTPVKSKLSSTEAADSLPTKEDSEKSITDTATAKADSTTIADSPIATTPKDTNTTTENTSIINVDTAQPTPTPAYGEDPNNPGVYIVYNPIKFMSSVGVNPSEQDSMNRLIHMTTGWIYKNTTKDGRYLCDTSPKALPEGYIDDPTVQLKWCASYVKDKYGSWDNATNFFMLHKWF